MVPCYTPPLITLNIHNLYLSRQHQLFPLHTLAQILLSSQLIGSTPDLHVCDWLENVVSWFEIKPIEKNVMIYISASVHVYKSPKVLITVVRHNQRASNRVISPVLPVRFFVLSIKYISREFSWSCINWMIKTKPDQSELEETLCVIIKQKIKMLYLPGLKKNQ